MCASRDVCVCVYVGVGVGEGGWVGDGEKGGEEGERGNTCLYVSFSVRALVRVLTFFGVVLCFSKS